MKSLLLAAFASLLFVFAAAQAQTQAPLSGNAVVPASGVTPGAYACPSSITVNGSGMITGIVAGTCGGSGGTLNLAGAGCVKILGTAPNLTITTLVTVSPVSTGSIPIHAADGCTKKQMQCAAACTVTFDSAAALGNGFGVEIEVLKGSAPVALAGGTFHGGPPTLQAFDSVFIHADGATFGMLGGIARQNPVTFN